MMNFKLLGSDGILFYAMDSLFVWWAVVQKTDEFYLMFT
jgi:hypothetical protein